MYTRARQVEAERRLLQAALREPLNQRFVLLSEACLPIYPPHLLWAQLLAEARARVNACAAPTAADAARRYVKRCVPLCVPEASHLYLRSDCAWQSQCINASMHLICLGRSPTVQCVQAAVDMQDHWSDVRAAEGPLAPPHGAACA